MTKRDWQWAYDNDLTILHAEDLFGEMLDDVYGEVQIAGYTYMTSRALKETDPTAYRCGCADYIDSIVTEGAVYRLDDETLVSENPESVGIA